MKVELAAVKAESMELRSVDRRIIATLGRLEGKLDDMGERMATKEALEVVSRNIDGFAKLFDDFRFR